MNCACVRNRRGNIGTLMANCANCQLEMMLIFKTHTHIPFVQQICKSTHCARCVCLVPRVIVIAIICSHAIFEQFIICVWANHSQWWYISAVFLAIHCCCCCYCYCYRFCCSRRSCAKYSKWNEMWRNEICAYWCALSKKCTSWPVASCELCRSGLYDCN